MELNLLTKYEAQTNRVKGLAFHPYRSWILASLHNGVIQLYDYRMEILLDTFEEHEGPVRGIDFHPSQPLFVSGGDDYKVKVWNYQLKRCLYTLNGHLDYIRTVYFHPNEHPWILSASDDQTVRIWNWQSRNCLLVLTGHNHYVMCAQWHPSEDLILSASLDQTVRVWDISGLRRRNTSIINEDTLNNGGGGGGLSGSGKRASSSATGDVFGSVDAVVKFVLEGHTRGVNWANFHPSMNLVVSAADDREVKIWRMSGSRAWETMTFRGHLNNVSCCLFHPKEKILITNSEDKTMRIWDLNRSHPSLTFRRENDRYWILAAHPRLNLLAAGHDNGMLIFKLSRERPAFYTHLNKFIYYYNDGYIRMYDIHLQSSRVVVQTKQHLTRSGFGGGGSGGGRAKRAKRPRRLIYNPYSSSKEVNVIMFYSTSSASTNAAAAAMGGSGGGSGGGGSSSTKSSSSADHSSSFGGGGGGAGHPSTNMSYYNDVESEYELYVIDKKNSNNSKSVGSHRTSARSVAFVNRNRFAVLEHSSQITVVNKSSSSNDSPSKQMVSYQQILFKNMDNITKKKIRIPMNRAGGSSIINYLFEGGNGRLILRSAEWVTLFDVLSRKIVKEIQIPTRFAIKFVCWDSSEYEKCALLAKFSVMICDANLNDICTIYENAKVKSGEWNTAGDVFLYTTVTHMKYALPSGDHGIIKTLDEVYYICNINQSLVTCLTRDWIIKRIEIDATEYVFKKALISGKFTQVKRLIQAGKLKGESIIGYLQKKGFAEVALRFVEDNATRFDLALECGHIDVAFECARNINSKQIWKQFGTAALMQGNYRCVTEAYKQTLNFEKLMYLFILTGNYPTLEKLMEIGKTKGDRMLTFNIALLTNNIEAKLECLKDSQQYGLAYLMARSHGLTEHADAIQSEFLSDKQIIIPEWFEENNNSAMIQPPRPVFGPYPPSEDFKYDWPRKELPTPYFDREDTVDVKENELKSGEATDATRKQYADDSDDDNTNAVTNEFDMNDGGGKMDSFIDDDADDGNIDFEDWDNSNARGKKGKKQSNSASPAKSVDSNRNTTALMPDEDIDFLSDDEDEDNNNAADDDTNLQSLFVMPTQGSSPRKKWLERSVCASDMITGGSFDLAQESLHRQFGIVNFVPLKPYFLRIYNGCQSYANLIPNSHAFTVGMRRNPSNMNEYMANISISLKDCHEYMKQAYISVTNGGFDTAIELFRKVLHMIPLLCVSSNDELKSVRNLIETCREYINALRVKIAADAIDVSADAKSTTTTDNNTNTNNNNNNDDESKSSDTAAADASNNSLRKFELLCYFTHFDLQDSHLFSALYGAMKNGYKSQNFKTTAVLCRRLLELAQTGRVTNESSLKYAKQVKKVLDRCESKNVDKNETSIEYKPHSFRTLCCISFRPISINEQSVKCCYCGSIFKEQYNGDLAPVCLLVRIGSSAQGVTINAK